MSIHGILPPLHGRGHIWLFDDEWLPPPSVLTRVPDRDLDPVLQAISLSDLSGVRARLGRGVEPPLRNGALWLALAEDDSCVVGALLTAGADPNLRDRDGFTVLMAASRYGALKSARKLLEAGADVNANANFGRTALLFASGNQDMVRLLTDHGAHE